MGHIFFTLPYNVYARAYWRTAGYAPEYHIFNKSSIRDLKHQVIYFVKNAATKTIKVHET